YRGEVAAQGRGYFPLHLARNRSFGGSTACWGGICRPLDPIDFESRDWVPHSGWPFGLEELEPWYAKAQTLAELPDRGYAVAEWADRDRRPLPLRGDRVASGIFQLSPPTLFALVH